MLILKKERPIPSDLFENLEDLFEGESSTTDEISEDLEIDFDDFDDFITHSSSDA
jgi:hypothetical protein